MIRVLPEITHTHSAAAHPLHRKHAAAATPFAELMTTPALAPAASAAPTPQPAAAAPASPAASAPAPAAPAAPAASAGDSSGPSLAALFHGSVVVQSASPTNPQNPSIPDPTPTLQSIFGPTPWITSPTGHDFFGNSFNFNPIYFATEQTAAKVAQMLGGTVIQQNDIITAASPIGQNQPNYMVKLANGSVINPGLVANFYTHGYPQSYINRMLSAEATQGVMS